MRVFAAILLITNFICAPAWPKDQTPAQGKYYAAGLDDDREVEQFFLSFKAAIAKGDKEKVAAMVHYPIAASLASGQRVK